MQLVKKLYTAWACFRDGAIIPFFFSKTMFQLIAIFLLILAYSETQTIQDRGLAAELYLTKGTTMLHAIPPHTVIYRRSGGRYAAYADFHALKPTEVVRVKKTGKTEVLGKIGKYAGLILTIEEGAWPDIKLARYVPGKDHRYSYYMKVFWYMDGFLDKWENRDLMLKRETRAKCRRK